MSRKHPVGFFSSFLQMLGYLYLCEKENMTPVVYFRDNCYFWEDEGWNGSRNPWEYYFYPVSQYSAFDLVDVPPPSLESCERSGFTSNMIILHDSGRRIELPPNIEIRHSYPKEVMPTHYVDEERRQEFNNLIRKYIVIRPNIEKKINDFKDRHFRPGKIIGLHIRGKEHSYEIEKKSRNKPLPLYLYFKEVDRFFRENPRAMVFVATDTENIREKVKSRYGERCIYSEGCLSDDGKAPHKQFGGAKIGEEVLIDCLLLSKCDFLVHGISGVSFTSLYFNPTLEHVNVYRKYKYLSKPIWYIQSRIPKIIKKRLRFFSPF